MRIKDCIPIIGQVGVKGEPIIVIREKFAKGLGFEVSLVFGLSEIRSLGLTDKVVSRIEKLIDANDIVELVDLGVNADQKESLIVEVLKPRFRLLVLGAGHVGQAVAMVGALVGFEVIEVDDRDVFLTRERLPDDRIQLVSSCFEDAVNNYVNSPNVGVVIVTRGHQSDEVCLRTVLMKDFEVKYLGMIGSRRRVESIKRRLRAEGIREDKLNRLHAPIGLSIGAVTPQEIAVAIIGEVIKNLRNVSV